MITRHFWLARETAGFFRSDCGYLIADCRDVLRETHNHPARRPRLVPCGTLD